jgi:hypothetical protein
MSDSKKTWDSLCPACAAPLPREAAFCPACGSRTVDVEQLLKEAEGKYSHDAKVKRLKREFRTMWIWTLAPGVAHFMVWSPGLLAIFLLRKTSILRDELAYQVVMGYWIVSAIVGFALHRLLDKITRIVEEEIRDDG